MATAMRCLLMSGARTTPDSSLHHRDARGDRTRDWIHDIGASAAMGVAHQTAVMTASPAAIPQNAEASSILGARVPIRNAPSTGPDAKDKTASPASRTDRSMN